MIRALTATILCCCSIFNASDAPLSPRSQRIHDEILAAYKKMNEEGRAKAKQGPTKSPISHITLSPGLPDGTGAYYLDISSSNASPVSCNPTPISPSYAPVQNAGNNHA